MSERPKHPPTKGRKESSTSYYLSAVLDLTCYLLRLFYNSAGVRLAYRFLAGRDANNFCPAEQITPKVMVYGPGGH